MSKSKHQESLKDARENGTLSEFIKEHEQDEPGDLDKLDEVIKRSSQERSSEARKSFREGSSDD